MCNIRIIFKTSDHRILKDQVFALDNLEISPIDRPSYVTCVTEDDRFICNSNFLNEAESFIDVRVDNQLSFSYGALSGRIRQLVTSYNHFHDTTFFRCKQSVPDNLNKRVHNNINEYLKLYGIILDTLNESALYPIEEAVEETDVAYV